MPLTLTPEHLAPFAADAFERFVMHLCDLLGDHFPDAATEAPASLRDGVREQIVRAGAYGLTVEADAAAYVIAAWVLGEHFDTQFPAAARVLADGDRPPSVRAAWLRKWTHGYALALRER